MKANAVPTPVIKKCPARSAQKCPCTGTWVAHSMPPSIRAMPAAITSLAEPHTTSASASQARPARSAGYPSTCCMYSVPMEMNAKKLAPSSRAVTKSEALAAV